MSYPLNTSDRMGDRPILMKVTAGHRLARPRDMRPLQEDKTAVTEVGCARNLTVEGGLCRTLVHYRIGGRVLPSRVAVLESP